ncbi:hypothetical protein NDU88_000462 [Pleurodeles waltl]|uniref:Uncharacterized protein n=1 Tax=Pleurodeles waltl TaxID=8319 RepID=A0AAV7V6V4_PLEWA|nr:hypothetical protein NDU88_000462 [Pleurodeles waltl]
MTQIRPVPRAGFEPRSTLHISPKSTSLRRSGAGTVPRTRMANPAGTGVYKVCEQFVPATLSSRLQATPSIIQARLLGVI